MLKDKIVGLLTELDEDVLQEFFNCEFQSEPWAWDSDEVKAFRQVLTDNSITFGMIDCYGGEGQGDDYWSVYEFTDGTQIVLIKFDGWYASYQGSTYNEFYEVKSIEKTIVVFKKV